MQRISLNGAWQLSQIGEPEVIPAQAPGCVHTDLLAAGRIEDPFYRDNEDRLRWIGEADWIYSRTFVVPDAMLNHDRILLRCEGLDTLATLRLNDREVARTDNMFRTWEFDVREALHAGENNLSIRFDSTLPVIRQKQDRRPLPGWGGPKEIRGRAWIRKEPCNFGWDWGLVLVTCGIWRPIELVAFNGARLKEASIRQDHTTQGAVQLDVAISAESTGQAELVAEVTIRLKGTVVARKQATLSKAEGSVQLRIKQPQLWWPNGMGKHPLYDVTVDLKNGSGNTPDTVTKRIGLRTLRLDRHPDQWGESFQFVANGVPFFAKGANWIPADAFATRMTRENYAGLLHSAAEANMNMLRVWGGGIYEDDAFYELCDELGICVWHDFMFACSTYPTFDADFMKNVRAEAEDNVRRIRHHPCVALWCGNNELEQGLVGDAWSDHQMSWEDYSKLFDQLLPEVVKHLDPQRDYWPSSPHSPVGDRRDFNNPHHGDAHLWNVWHGREPFEWYRTCEHRFNSEFGFQSFPEPRTVCGYTLPQDRNVTTHVMEHHQRSGVGNTIIMQYMLDWFRLPASFESNLWLSQILQGMAMKYAVEHWRRAMPRGMGTLYWQLNDCWPVASWSSIDYHGRWKALHYMARRFYAPLLVSGVEDLNRGIVDLHVTSDSLSPRDRLEQCEGELLWCLTDLEGKTLTEGHRRLQIPARANTLACALDVAPFLRQYGPRQLLLWLDLKVAAERVSSNLILFARPKHLELLAPNVTCKVQRKTAGKFLVSLEAQHPALWVWLELMETDGRYSENFFHLRPGLPLAVEVTPAERMTVPALKRRLQVHSLVDTYTALR